MDIKDAKIIGVKHAERSVNSSTRFLLLFVVTVIFSQFLLWRNTTFADNDFWVQKVVFLNEHFQTKNFIFNSAQDPTHPGTTVTLIAVAFTKTGIQTAKSIQVAEILLNIFFIFLIAFVTWRLRPNSFWWIGISVFFIFNNFFSNTNPIDIIVSELIVITFLLALKHFEDKQKISPNFIWGIGIALGLSMATRIHFSLLMCAPLLCLLIPQIGLKKVSLISLTALTVFYIFTPYAWPAPLHFFKVALLGGYTTYGPETDYVQNFNRFSLFDLSLEAPLATLSFIMSLFFMLIKTSKPPIPRLFLFTLNSIIGITVWSLMQSNINEIRYLYPTIFILYAFLPLFLLSIVNQFKEIFHKNFTLIRKNEINFSFLAILLMQILLLVWLFSIDRKDGFIHEKYLTISAQIQSLIILLVVFFLKESSSTKNKIGGHKKF